MHRRTILTLSLLLTLATGAVTLVAKAGPAATATPAAAADLTSPYAWFEPLVDIERIIADRYVDKPDLKAMQLGSIKGMIEALHDPYTQFIPASALSEFDKQLRGRYVGIGAAVNIQDGEVTIVTPLDDSPAFHAGIMAGDKVIAVDGKPTEGHPLPETVNWLTGEPGTKVVLTIRRADEEFDVSIIRQQIVTRTVSGWRRLGEQWDYLIDPANKIGYARLSQFNMTSPRELRAALDKMQADNMRGFVLDLRFNPGGLVVAATQIADMFLKSGLIITTKGRAVPEQPIYATSKGTLGDFPMVVLVNRQSASASEMLSGALRDNGRAIVVGTRTFGKGVAQNVIALPSGAGQLKITEQHYYGPSGKKINRDDDSTDWGVDPSPGFFAPMSDQQYRDMLTVQRDNAIIRKDDAGPSFTPGKSPQWITDDLKDIQLADAVNAIIGKLDTGQWTPISDEDVKASVELGELRRMKQAKERLERDMDRVERRITALSSVAPEDQLPVASDLVPEGIDLKGGKIKLYKADGELVTTLNITGAGLARWLIDAPVEKEQPVAKPQDEDQPSPDQSPKR